MLYKLETEWLEVGIDVIRRGKLRYQSWDITLYALEVMSCKSWPCVCVCAMEECAYEHLYIRTLQLNASDRLQSITPARLPWKRQTAGICHWAFETLTPPSQHKPIKANADLLTRPV